MCGHFVQSSPPAHAHLSAPSTRGAPGTLEADRYQVPPHMGTPRVRMAREHTAGVHARLALKEQAAFNATGLTTLMRTLLPVRVPRGPGDGDAESATPRHMKKQYSTPLHVTEPLMQLSHSMLSACSLLWGKLMWEIARIVFFWRPTDSN